MKIAHGTVQGFATVVGTRRRHGPERQQPDVRVLLAAAPVRRGQPSSRRATSPTRPTRSCSTRRRRATSGYKLGDEVPIVFLDRHPRSSTFVGVFRVRRQRQLRGCHPRRLHASHRAARRRPRRRVGLHLRRGEAGRVAGSSWRRSVRNDDRGHARRRRSTRCSPARSSPTSSASNVKDRLGFLNTFLLVFAFIALFVGSFIIYNTFSIIVAQRSRELALLRALGASGKQVTRSVAAEAFVVGLLSSVLGLALGVLVAIGLQGLLAAFGFELPDRGAGHPRPNGHRRAGGRHRRHVRVGVVAGAPRRASAAGRRDARHARSIASSGARRYRIGGLLAVIGIVLARARSLRRRELGRRARVERPAWSASPRSSCSSASRC